MFRIDDPSAVGSLPAPAAAGTEGFFTEGNPGTGVPATRVTADFLNMLMEEVRGVVVAGGLTPSKTTNTQLLAAIKAVAAGQFTQSLAAPGWSKNPSGKIEQWGLTAPIADNTAIVFPLAFPTSAFEVSATIVYGGAFASVMVTGLGLTGFTVRHNFAGTAAIYWTAVGK